MASLSVASAADFRARVESLRAALSQPETEDSWDTITRSIQTFANMCNNGACDFPTDLIQTIRSLARPLANGMVSERTRLSGAALDLVTTVAAGLGSSFDPLVPLFLPVLLSLCARTNKVIITRARACISTIVEATQLPSILPFFLQSIKDKSTTLRLAAAEGTLACMNCFNPLDLEKEARARDIETIIRATATDSQAEIRAVGRKIFDAYKVLLPGRVESFTSPLTPTIKKYLDIKTSNVRTKPTLPKLASSIESKSGQLSTSLSTSATSTQRQQPQRPTTHLRSSATSATGQVDTNGPTTKHDRPAPPKKPSTDMPPPQFVPVRPTPVSAHAGSSAHAPPPAGATQTAPLLRPQAPSSSTLPARGGAARSGPHRPQKQVSVAPPQEPSAGPRRVLVPEVAPKPRQRVKSTVARPEALSIRPLASSSSSKGTSTGATHAKPKPVTKKTSLGSFPASKSGAEKPSRSGGLSQPTLSQLSRAKAAAKEKESVTAPSKTGTWGRRAPTNAAAAAKPASSRPASRAASVKGASRPESRNAGARAATPAQIPLPPSPTPSGLSLSNDPTVPEQVPIAFPAVSETPLSAEETPEDGCHSPNRIVSNETSATTSQDSTSAIRSPTPPPISTGTALTVTGAAEPGNVKTDDTHAAIEASEPTVDGTFSDAPIVEESTPRALIVAHDSIGALKTPISALLSSIQQGFLFTPSSPLSPPDSYRERDPMINDLPIAFPLNTEQLSGKEVPKPAKGQFMFGVGLTEVERTAFGNVENFDI